MHSAAHIGTAAADSLQPLADKSGSVCVGPGVESAGVLPPQRQTSLRAGGADFVLRALAAARRMSQLPQPPCRISLRKPGSAEDFRGRVCLRASPSGVPSSNGAAASHLV